MTQSKRVIEDEEEVVEVARRPKPNENGELDFFMTSLTIQHENEWFIEREKNALEEYKDGFDLEPHEMGRRWLEAAGTIRTHYDNEVKQVLKKLAIRTREEVVMGEEEDEEFNMGDERLRKLRWLLDNMGIVRESHQIDFHEAFIPACLEKIYGDEWETSNQRVMEEMSITEIKNEVFILTPRRYGKTYSIAMYALAIALCVPGINIAIFSTGKRASSTLMTEMVRMASRIPGALDRICRKTEEQLFFASNALQGSTAGLEAKHASTLPTTSRINSFPSSVNCMYTCTHTLYVAVHLSIKYLLLYQCITKVCISLYAPCMLVRLCMVPVGTPNVL